ncbi:MAG: hypothetical protein IIT75_00080, partial [Candidatus Methanomethylophilus sp.]|nr:hypothetical protein [Methanomethylophilus sp.]
MSQKYPDEEAIVYAVRKVMLKKPRIESQREFAALVTEALKEEDPDTRISAARIRKVAVTSGVVKLDIGYRETDRSDLPDLCPVCG